SASSSGMSMLNSFSNSITSSTMSSESAPRSSMKEAPSVSFSRSTPSSFSMMSFTFAEWSAIVAGSKWGWRGCTIGKYSGAARRSHHHPAVHRQDLTGDVGGKVGGQEGHGAGDVVRRAEALERNLRRELRDGLGRHRVGHIGLDEARRHDVAEHVAAGRFLRDALAQADQAGLARGVVRLARIADQPDDARDVDDAAPALLHHSALRAADGDEGRA